MKKIYILGAGGVGSWLAPAICMLKDPADVTIIDGDTLEKKNLNRQLFDESDIGSKKADALGLKYGCPSVNKFYSHGMNLSGDSEALVALDSSDWLLVGVDNNPGRAAALQSCDAYGCRAIFGANETTSSEAYYYDPRWRGTQMDPRIYYPEIGTDHSDDPRAAAIGCTGDSQRSNRQLVTANFMAAALMQHLFVLWEIERKKFKREAIAHVPHRLRQNLTKFETFTAASIN